MDNQTQINSIRDGAVSSLGLDPSKLTDERKDALVEKMFSAIAHAVVLRCMEKLTPQLKTEATKAVEEKGDEVLLDFFAENIPNFDQIVAEETGKLKARMT
jgi:hypothetical protein